MTTDEKNTEERTMPVWLVAAASLAAKVVDLVIRWVKGEDPAKLHEEYLAAQKRAEEINAPGGFVDAELAADDAATDARLDAEEKRRSGQ
jgi:hypothetical protein